MCQISLKFHGSVTHHYRSFRTQGSGMQELYGFRMWRESVSCQCVNPSVSRQLLGIPCFLHSLLSWFNVSKMAIQLPARNTVNNVANNTKLPTCWRSANRTPRICHVIRSCQWEGLELTTWGSVLTDIIKRFELLKVKTIDWTHTRRWLNRSCNTSKFVVNLALYC